MKQWTPVGVVGWLLAACGGSADVPKEYGQGRQALQTGGTSFTRVITDGKAGKYNNVCTLEIPDVGPPLTVEVTHFTNGVSTHGESVTSWSGSDIIDTTYGNPGDRIEITGCTGGPPCMLMVSALSKGHDAGAALGCAMRVTDGATTVLAGDGVGVTIAGDIGSGRSRFRQKLEQNAGGTSYRHTCLLKILGATDSAGSFVGTMDLQQNGTPLWGSWSVTGLGPGAFPQPAAPPAPLGKGSVGVESDASLLRHVLPFGVLAPGDIVHCSAQVSNSGSGPQGQTDFNAAPPVPGDGIFLDAFTGGAGPQCGDGVRHRPTEMCDDGEDNGLPGFCRADCSGPGVGEILYLQNDDYTGGPFGLNFGVGQEEYLAARFTAAPEQYPFRIRKVRVMCGSGGATEELGAVILDIFRDIGSLNPSTLLYTNFPEGNLLSCPSEGAFNDIDLTSANVVVDSGTIRVGLFVIVGGLVGFATDTGGIEPGRNLVMLSNGQWRLAEDLGVTGDWILRVEIETP